MTPSQMELLSQTVMEYDSTGEPVTAAALATTVGAETDTVQAQFDDFEAKHLLKRVDEGYRPTLTARELLELDVDDDSLLIIETDPDE